MAIKCVTITDYLVFNGGFEAEFCHGVNVLIGDNATGKTTLVRSMYEELRAYAHFPKEFSVRDVWISNDENNFVILLDMSRLFHMVYIPEKDILEHAKGLLTFIEQKQTGFSNIYRDMLIAAQDIPTHEQSEMQKSIGEKIVDLIGGTIEWDRSEGTYYTIKADGKRIPFSDEASGYKRLGYLGLLVSSGQLRPGSILFWDEPENSLNPDIYPELVSILLELAQNDIQIFIATHDYNLARHLDVRKDKSIPVMFHNLVKADEGRIVCHSLPEYTKLPDNLLEKASEDLFEAVIANALGVQGDE